MFVLVSFRRRPEQMGTNMASPYKALKIKVFFLFFLVFRIWKIESTWNLASIFVFSSSYISRILDCVY